jgi:putative Mg2+ transporter-C (MgtC) family protein
MDLSIEIIIQLILAAFLGGLIGLEREYERKGAGLRTYTLISLGSAFFTIIGYHMTAVDPSRIIQAVATGIGFIGAGVIIHRQSHVEGVTTAAGLWVATAIGVAVGAKLYFSAIFASFLVLGVLIGLTLIKKRFFRNRMAENKTEIMDRE